MMPCSFVFRHLYEVVDIKGTMVAMAKEQVDQPTGYRGSHQKKDIKQIEDKRHSIIHVTHQFTYGSGLHDSLVTPDLQI